MRRTKAVVKYPGSKWGLAKWIISYFPEHHSYLEPFFGSGAVLFNKPRSNIETVNDLDGNVVNLFGWIRSDPERLAREIYFTPYSRQVYEDAFRAVPEDSLQKAVNFYVRLQMGHGFRTNGEKVGWKNDAQGRERAYAAKDWCELPEKIIQPYEYGHAERKSTCLWLKGLPKLVPTDIVKPELHVCGNGVIDSKWHYHTYNLPAKERAKMRSKTFPGIAKAMAEQWAGKEGLRFDGGKNGNF